MEAIDIAKTKEKLKQEFEEKGIRAKDIINFTSITTEAAVFNWLNPNNSKLPSLDTFIELSHYLNVPLDELIIHSTVSE